MRKKFKRDYYGEHLEGFLRKRNNELQGIINGVDYELYDPRKDSFLV